MIKNIFYFNNKMLTNIFKRRGVGLFNMAQIRNFAAAPGIEKYTDLDVRFNLKVAQVKINLPTMGPTWFFINNKTNAKEFMDMCT